MYRWYPLYPCNFIFHVSVAELVPGLFSAEDVDGSSALVVSITGSSVLNFLGALNDPIPAALSASSWLNASVFSAFTLIC